MQYNVSQSCDARDILSDTVFYALLVLGREIPNVWRLGLAWSLIVPIVAC